MNTKPVFYPACPDRYFSFRFRRVIVSILGVLVFIMFFFIFLNNPASADSGTYTELKSYETYLVKEGDTLNAIARDNAGRFSRTTSEEYMQDMIEFNNLESEYIQAGQYILLPNYI